MRSGIFGPEEGISLRSSIEALESRIAPATIFVTTLDDSGSGSLRAAIDQANDADGPDVIKFKVNGEILLESALPAITDSLMIKGKGSSKTVIDGAEAYRVLEIASSSPLDVTISGVTLQNGFAAESGGALEINNALGKVLLKKSAIFDSVALGAQGEDAVGGGIANHNALLTLTKCTISGNLAEAGAGEAGGDGPAGSEGVAGTAGQQGGQGSTARGGGIFNGYYAALTVVKSTISGNTVVGGDGGGGGNGGAAGTGAGNIAGDGGHGGKGGIAFGGGIDNRGSLSIQKSEISGNLATGGFGGNGGNAGQEDPASAGAYAGYGGDGGDAMGGGVSSDGALEVSRAGVYDNEAVGNYGGYSGTGHSGYDGYAGYGRGGGLGIAAGRALVDRTTISGNYAEYGGGVSIAGEEANIENSLILTNDALEGGGMYVEGSGTVLFNSVVQDNAASDGGGGIAAHGGLDIVRSRIVGNFADAFEEEPNSVGGGILVTGDVRIVESVVNSNDTNGDGGGIYVDEGSLALTRSIVSENTAAGLGGGIVAGEDSYISIYDSAVTDNDATLDGGGVRLHDYASVVVERSTISFNTADRDGGGISVEDSALLEVHETIVSGNTAGRNGGGISSTGADYYYDYYGGTIQAAETRIVRSTISGNTANDGAGIFHTGGYLDLIASTIAENAATGNGGGVSLSAAVTVLASTIASNSAGTAGGGLWIDAIVDPAVNWISSTIIADNAAPTGTDISRPIEATYTLVGDLDGADVVGDHNIVDVDPRLGPLKNNGGYTPTMLPKSGSPVTDSGTGLGEVFDQRGTLRLRGAGVDIGAVEAR